MSSRVVYIGTAEAPASSFVELASEDFPQLELFASDERWAALEHLGAAEVVIGHHFQFDRALIDQAPKLRWIQSLTAGTDAILRIPGLSREILVTSTRGMHGPQMAELVFLDMLALGRDFPRMLRNQSRHHWERWPQPLLSGKVAVIVGVGAIAEHLAPRCKAFGMTVYGVSASTRVPPGFDGVMSRDRIREAVARADFLILIVPLTAQTENLIDRSVLACLRPTAYLINVARGGVLDETALLDSVRAGTIAGAALDVFRETPLPHDHPLWREERVIITPLIGGMSDVYLQQAYPLIRDNLRLFLAGRPEQMVNIVSR